MADQPIDTSERPSMVSVECAGHCGQWIVVDRAFTGDGYCSECLHTRQGSPVTAVRVAPPDAWSSKHNPVPPPAVYPPGAAIAGIRVSDPDVAAKCLDHPRPADLNLMSLGPADIALAFSVHDRLRHQPTGWLIGGPGGASGDICNPCGGGNKDKTKMEQPRHDLCLRGNPRGGWGRYCPCTHDRPYMRGVKPAGQAQPALPTPRPAAPEVVVIDPPVTGYLFDPEDFDPEGDT